jgi:hypothetical protein
MQLRRRPSYANVAATLALVVAIGGGTAWAATHKRHHHYVITSTSQIRPKVLKKLHGAHGTAGTNGAPGAGGSKGATGPTGPTGVAGIVTSSNTSASLSATLSAVVDATAPVSGKILVTGQVNAERTNPQGDSEVGCSIVDITSAPGTELGSVQATFPIEGTANSFVDVPVQAQVSATAGDTIAIECIGGNAGYSAPEESISLIPVS